MSQNEFIECTAGSNEYIRVSDISVVYYVPVTAAKSGKISYRVVVGLRSGQKFDVSDHEQETTARAAVSKIIGVSCNDKSYPKASIVKEAVSNASRRRKSVETKSAC